MGRPLIEALDELEAERRGARPVQLHQRQLERRGVLADGQGPLPGALPEPGADRLDRRHRGRLHRHPHRGQGRHGHEGRRPDRVARASTPWCSTTTCSLVEPGSGVIGRVARGGNIPHRLLQGRGQDGGDLRGGRRRPALLDPRRLRHASRPTGASPCSAAARCASTPAARRSSPKRSSPCSRPTPTCSTPSWWVHPTSDGANGSPP